jgi:hypothetical protein
VITSPGHNSSYAARLGSPTAVNGDSTLTQTVVLPTGPRRLYFFYNPHCTDSLAFDQIQMQIRSTSGATLANVLDVCSNSGTWTQRTYKLPPSLRGQTAVLWFNVHDDGNASDPTYALVDDVSIR